MVMVWRRRCGLGGSLEWDDNNHGQSSHEFAGLESLKGLVITTHDLKYLKLSFWAPITPQYQSIN